MAHIQALIRRTSLKQHFPKENGASHGVREQSSHRVECLSLEVTARSDLEGEGGRQAPEDDSILPKFTLLAVG